MAHESNGDSAQTTAPDRVNGLASERMDLPAETPIPLALGSGPASLIFQIYVDFHGMHRWLLVNSEGQRLLASRHAFAGLAAAWRDAEFVRNIGDYTSAEIAKPVTG